MAIAREKNEGFQADTSDLSYFSTFALFTDGSGDLLVAGEEAFAPAAAGGSNILVRLNADGSVDESFDSGTGVNGVVRDIAMANDGTGDIYAVGTFSSYNGISARNVVRLNSDGSDDETVWSR